MDNKQTMNQAIKAFNETWEYIEKKDRTAEDNLKMIEFAYESKYNWSLVGNHLHFVRSDWQVSRVYAEAKLLKASLYYSTKCLEDTLKQGFKGFDLFFAYEANVRVYHLLKEFEKRDIFVQKAIESIELVEKQADKDYCKSELDKILNL